jgi:hypothetical protein
LIEEEILTIPEEDTSMAVSMNRFAVVSLALYGSQDRVEALCIQCYQALKKLKLLRAARKTEPFDVPPAGQGSYPHLLDVIRWLESLDSASKEEIEFAKRLYVTARRRSRPDLVLEHQGEE